MEPLGDSAIMVRFGSEVNVETHEKVQELSRYIENDPPPGVVEFVPAFTNVTIYYDIVQAATMADDSLSPYEFMANQLDKIIKGLETSAGQQPEVVEIPVCYGGEFGPDLDFVAEHNQLTPEEVIQIHSAGSYLTYMIGFAPGFPYLGGLSEKIAAPRRETPRLEIPEGTVGIAGMQTGVYPISTPGGWQLIGRTPIRLFRPEQNPPTLLKTGNVIKFKPISLEEYQELLEVER
ncbi:5-oxoprolinase subunit PxpB [Neobacillus muris]|uniref:5-oxoprolinase subunit PxpB n=1 Tax=Neobacillus muris TaxID=2941334 RepID=UPI0030B9FC02